jgi:uncharacterized membrane protein YphA (DoxX/SURF4 family)
MNAKKVAKETGIWIVTALLVFIFATAGIRKFPDSGFWSEMFRKAGLPVWFRLAVGAWETAAAALLLYTRTAAYGAGAVVIVMLGALGTNAVTGIAKGSPAPVISLLLALIVLAARWSQRLTITPLDRLAPQR